MKKILFIILIIIQTVSCSAQELQLPVRKTVAVTMPEEGVERRNNIVFNDTTHSALNEIQWFIDKRDSICKYYTGEGNEFAVYVLHVYREDSLQQGYCYTLSYILNSNEYASVNPDYYFNVDDEIVLVRLGKYIRKDNIIKFKLEELVEEKVVRTVQKLYPSVLGGFTYQPAGMVYCIEGEKVESTYYENADEIPFSKSIYTTFPEGNIELIKEGN